MILKYIKLEVKALFNLRYSFAQPPKKKTQAPKYVRSKDGGKIDPKKVDYSIVPQDLKKGVKAYVQATNMLVTSEAQLQAFTLKEVILQERNKFQETLDKIGQSPAKTSESQVKKEQNTAEEKSYDLLSAIKFTSNVSNILMASNIAGYMLLHTLKRPELLGFFLGVSMNPSIIALTGLSIGFNAAAWIIIQSLHLSIRDPNQLTPDKVSLTGCSSLMYLQALSIAVQTGGLSYYLMHPHPQSNIIFLIGSFALAQTHLAYSIIRATGGYRFEFLSKILITHIMSAFIIGALTYSLFSKINQSKESQKYGSILNLHEDELLNENSLIRKGYERFLSEFKTKDFSVVKGEAINKLIIDETK